MRHDGHRIGEGRRVILTPTTLLTVQTVALIVLTLLILYPVAAYAQNVMHTEAVVALAVTLLLFTVSSIVKHLGFRLAGELIHLATDVALLTSVWLFAREFIRTDAGFDRSTGVTGPPGTGADSGGFGAGDPDAGGFADADDEATGAGGDRREDG